MSFIFELTSVIINTIYSLSYIESIIKIGCFCKSYQHMQNNNKSIIKAERYIMFINLMKRLLRLLFRVAKIGIFFLLWWKNNNLLNQNAKPDTE